jgi:hypothetical protein
MQAGDEVVCGDGTDFFVAVEVEAGMRLRSGLRRGVVADFFVYQGCDVGRGVACVADVLL